jgi:uncharacterized membrane protein
VVKREINIICYYRRRKLKSIKIILGGIGFLIFTICSILLIDIAQWLFLTIPVIISFFLGIIMVISGLFISDNNINKE